MPAPPNRSCGPGHDKSVRLNPDKASQIETSISHFSNRMPAKEWKPTNIDQEEFTLADGFQLPLPPVQMRIGYPMSDLTSSRNTPASSGKLVLALSSSKIALLKILSCDAARAWAKCVSRVAASPSCPTVGAAEVSVVLYTARTMTRDRRFLRIALTRTTSSSGMNGVVR
ncbi:hypothetical protein [Sphingobium mellinum]|uniref:hypothetical protein n=1 Tax=Sphingobium mellinum TaxID=1387166 RepID=UPI0030EEC943